MAKILVIGAIIGVFAFLWLINLVTSIIRLKRSDTKQRLIIVFVVTILSIIIIARNLRLMQVPMNKILDGAVLYLFGWFPVFAFYVLRLKEKQCWLLLLYSILFDLIIFLSLTLLIMWSGVDDKIVHIQNIAALISTIIGMVLSFVLVTKQKLPFTKM